MDTDNNASKFDINNYRVTQKYGEGLSSKKLITTVGVHKPNKGRFFRTSSDPENTMDVWLFEDKAETTFHLVNPEVAMVLGGLVRAMTLYLAVDRANTPFLIPIPLPSENGARNPWHQSLVSAVQAAEIDWVRIEADKSAGIYQVFVALGELPEPVWPDKAIADLIAIAFSGRMINDMDHPKVQAALGRV
jgi:hypothetical protein